MTITLSPNAAAALEYIRTPERVKPLGGLKLAAFRTARAELAAKDYVVQDAQGRWVIAVHYPAL